MEEGVTRVPEFSQPAVHREDGRPGLSDSAGQVMHPGTDSQDSVGEACDDASTEQMLKTGAASDGTKERANDTVKNSDNDRTNERVNDGSSASLETCITRAFSLTEKDWSQYSPLTLAYIGDCVYDLVVRSVLVKRCNKPTDRLHRETAGVVRAVAQSEAARKLMEEFTPQELSIYRRGKNAKPHTMAKHATRKEYLQATGLEAVLGYLYLDGQYERAVQLVKMAAGDALE